MSRHFSSHGRQGAKSPCQQTAWRQAQTEVFGGAANARRHGVVGGENAARHRQGGEIFRNLTAKKITGTVTVHKENDTWKVTGFKTAE